MQTIVPAPRTFEATIWEKAEHWTFYATVRATSQKDALELLRKDYPTRSYTIRDIR